MRVATYARTATVDQGAENEALVTQEQKLEKFCRVRGYSVVEQITDEGVSGLTLARPGIVRIQELVEGGAIDAILVASLDRLSRSRTDLRQLVEWLYLRGVQVPTPEPDSGAIGCLIVATLP